MAEWTVVNWFPGEGIGTVATRSRFSGDMEDNRHCIIEGKRGVSGNLLCGHNRLPSANPRGDTALERFSEHIWYGPGCSTLSTNDSLHSDLNMPRLPTIVPHYDQHADAQCALAYPLSLIGRYA
jgi:hypothetical protein